MWWQRKALLVLYYYQKVQSYLLAMLRKNVLEMLYIISSNVHIIAPTNVWASKQIYTFSGWVAYWPNWRRRIYWTPCITEMLRRFRPSHFYYLITAPPPPPGNEVSNTMSPAAIISRNNGIVLESSATRALESPNSPPIDNKNRRNTRWMAFTYQMLLCSSVSILNRNLVSQFGVLVCGTTM